MVRHERLNHRASLGPIVRWALKFLLLLAVFSSSAQASTLAQQKVLEISGQVRQRLSAKQKHEANQYFLEQFDMARFGKRCLLDHWDSFSASEQKRFTDLLFQNLLKAADAKNFFVHDEKTFRLVPQQELSTNGLVEIKNKLETAKKVLSLRLFLFSEQGTYKIVD